MTDKELLELAAKAANKDISWESSNMFGFWAHDLETGCEWNPLTNDGDALRLAVKLGFTVEQWKDAGCVYVGFPGNSYADEKHNTAPYAATRRAIVKAAAEIGKTL